MPRCGRSGSGPLKQQLQWRSVDRGYGTRTASSRAGRSSAKTAADLSFTRTAPAPPSTLAAADAIVLLGSFAVFVPAGAAGRRQTIALRGMATRLGTEEEGEMLRTFLQRCAAFAADCAAASPRSEPAERCGPGTPARRPASTARLQRLARGLACPGSSPGGSGGAGRHRER